MVGGEQTMVLAAANNETAGAKQSVCPWKFHKHQSKRDGNIEPTGAIKSRREGAKSLHRQKDISTRPATTQGRQIAVLFALFPT